MDSTPQEEADEFEALRLFRLIKRTLLVSFGILVGVVQLNVDPFGMETMLDDLSAEVFSNLISPFYGPPKENSTIALEGKNYRTGGSQSEILVVLIDDNSGLTWPVGDPREFRPLLQRLANNEASQIFLDIFFDNRLVESGQSRNDITENPTTLSTTENCSPVSGSGHRSSSRSEQIFELLQYAGSLGKPVIFSELEAYKLSPEIRKGCGTVDPTSLNVEVALIESNPRKGFYQLTNGCRLSPALTLFRNWCSAHPREGAGSCTTPAATCKFLCDARSGKCDRGDGETIGPQLFSKDMFVYWGYAPSELMTEVPFFGGQDCMKPSYSFLGQIGHSLRLLWLGAIHGFREEKKFTSVGDKLLCPYHTQVSFSQLMSLSDEEMKSIVKGRVVLVGTSLERFPDYRFSPVHGYIPGVFYHAMALDNLIAFQDEYVGEVLDADANLVQSIGLILVLGLQASMVMYVEFYLHKEQSAVSIQRLAWEFRLFTVTLLCACVWVVSGLFRLPPTNWIGLAGLLFVLSFHSNDELESSQFPLSAIGKYFRYEPDAASFSPRKLAIYAFLNVIIAAVLLILLGYVFIVVPQIIFPMMLNGFGPILRISVLLIFIGCLGWLASRINLRLKGLRTERTQEGPV
ncbi:CHASE2 domain-containing protein [Mangrovimicrobium sediminis]|uniref:CHASE2 domain-containing protein n=1 Tax=Mangrovimicrobium sediminis TaxID=2562682 RepID=A0A4Z0M5X7_9GAMM|nr:CHASE2 domain-containing protein [Haliea sp. SAOS-164]TGD74894.1 CHASE2 domain-containing protein [Haliea sp. SAOS-164]